MPSATIGQTPSLSTFLKSQKSQDVDTSIELLVSLLKRRQIRNSRPCAIATAHLLLRVVGSARWHDSHALIKRIREVGRKLVSAQPREMAVGNIVRRVLGVVREVAEEDGDETASNDGIGSPARGERPYRPGLPTNISSFSPLHHGAAIPQHTLAGVSSPVSPSLEASIETLPPRPQMPASAASYAGPGPHAGSLFGLFQQPTGLSPMATPPFGSGTATPVNKSQRPDDKPKIDLRAEVCSGIDDLLEELDIVDTQIAESALDHIHSNEIILTHTSSQTVQRFLAAAAKKRKFTVVHAEAYPNDHSVTHATIVNGSSSSFPDDDPSDSDARWKPLTQLGIKVILIPDTAVFALMSRVTKVIMAPHTVLANGSLIAAAGASAIAQAAHVHRVPVVVLSGVYKLSPVYPFDTDELIEYGDPGKVVGYEEGEFMDRVDVVNPCFDHVHADLVGLYITNLGGHAPSFLYRIVADHYRVEDVDLSAKD